MASTDSITIALDGLCGEAQPLLDAIDSLRTRGVPEGVRQPRIVVVGETSSGKSSVLQAISTLPFPGSSTRFATEIVLRKAAVRSLNVSIRSSAGKPSSRLRLNEEVCRSGDVPRIITAAKSCMETHLDSALGVTKDVLCVEVEGPRLQNLTLVDLPGLLPLHKSGQSSGDVATVHQLARRYMQRGGSIILSVVAANTPDKIQKALEECKVYDPEMARTLTVITKPDLASFERVDGCVTVCDRENKDIRYSIPSAAWRHTHVLRARTNDERDKYSQDSASQDFISVLDGSYPGMLQPENRGAISLPKKLSITLRSHAQTLLSKFTNDIEENLEESRARLSQIHNASSEARKAYLVKKAGAFQKLAHDAVNGVYGDVFFGGFGDLSCKLKANISTYNHAFSTVLSACGVISREDSGQGGDTTVSTKMLESGARSTSDLDPSVAQYGIQGPKPVSRSGIINELKSLSAAHHRLTKPFNAPDKQLAAHLFQKQIRPCERIAKHHAHLVVVASRDFINRLASYVFTQEECAVFIALYVDPFFKETRTLLNDKVEELFRPYAEGHALPLETRITKNLPGWHTADWAEQTADLVEAYYKVFLDTFAENVVNLAVESCLVRELEHIFSPDMVARISSDDLIDLAAGSQHRITERMKLTEKMQKLQDALELCQRHVPKAILPSASKCSTSSGRSIDAPPTTPTPIKALPAAATTPRSKTPPQAGTSTSPECSAEGGATECGSKGVGKTMEFKAGGLFGPKAGLSPRGADQTTPSPLEKAKLLSSPVFSQSSPAGSTEERNRGCDSSEPALKDGTKETRFNVLFSDLSLTGETGKTSSSGILGTPTPTDKTRETKTTSPFASPLSAETLNSTDFTSCFTLTPKKTGYTKKAFAQSSAGSLNPTSSSASPFEKLQWATPSLRLAPKWDFTPGSKQTAGLGGSKTEEKDMVKWHPLNSSVLAFRSCRTPYWLGGAKPTEFVRSRKDEGQSIAGQYFNSISVYDHISASETPVHYQGYSPEELRWRHYKGERNQPSKNSDPFT